MTTDATAVPAPAGPAPTVPAAMSKSRLFHIKNRESLATRGPWKQILGSLTVSFPKGVRVNDWGSAAECRTHEDAAFVAHAREDIPALIAEVERLRSLMKDVRDRLSGYETAEDASDLYDLAKSAYEALEVV